MPSIASRAASGLRSSGLDTGVLLCAGVLIVSLLGSSLGGSNIQQVVLLGLINMVFVVTLFVFSGNSGVFAFGHLAFAMIGAYVAAITTVPPQTKRVLLPGMPHWLAQLHLNPLVAMLLGAIAAAVVALVLAVPVIRLNGLIAALGSFILLAVAYSIATNYQAVTGGTTGLAGVPLTTTQTRATIVTLIVIMIIALFQGTTWALRLRASREDEVAARAAGIGVFTERTIAWVLGAFLAGAGGAMYAGYVGTVSPDTFYLDPTFIVLAMLIVGGLRSLTGAVVGAVFISIIVQLFTQMEEGFHVGFINFTAPSGFEQVGLAVITLLVLLLRREGLVGDHDLKLPRALPKRRRRRPPAHDTAPLEVAAPVGSSAGSGR